MQIAITDYFGRTTTATVGVYEADSVFEQAAQEVRAGRTLAVALFTSTRRGRCRMLRSVVGV